MLDTTTTTTVVLLLCSVRVVRTATDAVVTLADVPEESGEPVVSGIETDGADDADAVAFVRVGEDPDEVAFVNKGAELDDAEESFKLEPVVSGTEADAVAVALLPTTPAVAFTPLTEAVADDDALAVAVVLA